MKACCIISLKACCFLHVLIWHSQWEFKPGADEIRMLKSGVYSTLDCSYDFQLSRWLVFRRHATRAISDKYSNDTEVTRSPLGGWAWVSSSLSLLIIIHRRVCVCHYNNLRHPSITAPWHDSLAVSLLVSVSLCLPHSLPTCVAWNYLPMIASLDTMECGQYLHLEHFT